MSWLEARLHDHFTCPDEGTDKTCPLCKRAAKGQQKQPYSPSSRSRAVLLRTATMGKSGEEEEGKERLRTFRRDALANATKGPELGGGRRLTVLEWCRPVRGSAHCQNAVVKRVVEEVHHLEEKAAASRGNSISSPSSRRRPSPLFKRSGRPSREEPLDGEEPQGGGAGTGVRPPTPPSAPKSLASVSAFANAGLAPSKVASSWLSKASARKAEPPSREATMLNMNRALVFAQGDDKLQFATAALCRVFVPVSCYPHEIRLTLHAAFRHASTAVGGNS